MHSMKLAVALILSTTPLWSVVSDAPLYSGLESFHTKGVSTNKKAQRYYDQGLVLFYGYNFPEAARSFRQAALLDSQCAMCFWGEALALADCINQLGMDACKDARQSIETATKLTETASPRDRALVHALAVRFSQASPKCKLNNDAYTDAMRRIYQQFPDDPDVAALFVKALMDDHKSDKEAEEVLNKALLRWPLHPALNHFNIHILEAIGQPAKALESAKRLDGLIPGVGHLQHMPAHIYYDVGLYHLASDANQRGVDADKALFSAGAIKIPEYAAFYVHNYYYLFSSLAMEGRSKEDLQIAGDLINALKSGDLPSTERVRATIYSVPYTLMVRFGKWDQLINEPRPKETTPFNLAIWQYGVGLANLRKGNSDQAKRLLSQLQTSRKRFDERKDHGPEYADDLSGLLNLAYLDLAAQIAGTQGDRKEQKKLLMRAMQIEYNLNLEMLPWYLPMRQAVGTALLEAGKPQEAQEVFEEDLQRHPHNGWALFGLMQSLRAQGKTAEANAIEGQFSKAWHYADIKLTAPRL